MLILYNIFDKNRKMFVPINECPLSGDGHINVLPICLPIHI